MTVTTIDSDAEAPARASGKASRLALRPWHTVGNRRPGLRASVAAAAATCHFETRTSGRQRSPGRPSHRRGTCRACSAVVRPRPARARMIIHDAARHQQNIYDANVR